MERINHTDYVDRDVLRNNIKKYLRTRLPKGKEIDTAINQKIDSEESIELLQKELLYFRNLTQLPLDY